MDAVGFRDREATGVFGNLGGQVVHTQVEALIRPRLEYQCTGREQIIVQGRISGIQYILSRDCRLEAERSASEIQRGIRKCQVPGGGDQSEIVAAGRAGQRSHDEIRRIRDQG